MRYISPRAPGRPRTLLQLALPQGHPSHLFKTCPSSCTSIRRKLQFLCFINKARCVPRARHSFVLFCTVLKPTALSGIWWHAFPVLSWDRAWSWYERRPHKVDAKYAMYDYKKQPKGSHTASFCLTRRQLSPFWSLYAMIQVVQS